jgi:hypothetical protein
LRLLQVPQASVMMMRSSFLAKVLTPTPVTYEHFLPLKMQPLENAVYRKNNKAQKGYTHGEKSSFAKLQKKKTSSEASNAQYIQYKQTLSTKGIPHR